MPDAKPTDESLFVRPDSSPGSVDGTSSDRSTGSDARSRSTYRSPEGPGEDHWLALGIKMSGAMLAGDLVARAGGFEDPTWSVITAAFLATNPPIASVRAAGRKLFALVVGLALGATGAWASQALSGVPALHFALVGLVAGALGTRSTDYLFAAVVGTIVTFAGSGGGDPLAEVITTTACMVLIGCVVAPAVVWCVERVRRFAAERHA